MKIVLLVTIFISFFLNATEHVSTNLNPHDPMQMLGHQQIKFSFDSESQKRIDDVYFNNGRSFSYKEVYSPDLGFQVPMS